MKITLVMVASVDGKTTRGNEGNIYKWVSKEDFAHFVRMRKSHQVLIMGRKTYEAVKPKPQRQPLRIVLTRSPRKYKKLELPGQLEFTDELPSALVKRLRKFGYEKILLVGGGNITRDFLKVGLVDDLYLTIEPFLFGTGNPVVDPIKLNVALQLATIKKMNKKGTLLLHYLIKK